jgi:ATP-dependent DNA helicase RecG
MTLIHSLADLLLLRESVDLEVKRAQGQHGRGELPSDFWPSYSALANTAGGVIALGVRERSDGSFEALGIAEPERVRGDLWNLLNNRQRVSVNLLHEQDVQLLDEDGRVLLLVHVPRATRQQRPVYVGQNPLDGTYRRNFSGDYRCTPDEVKRMLADAQPDTWPDSRILPEYSLADLHQDSFKAYRNAFKSAKPDHPWLAHDDQGLLERLGGWRRDRRTKEEGLTVAGLLMFSEFEQIREVIPNFWLDYREVDPSQPDVRWVDRLTEDGTWSGNVYDFYRQVYRRLVRDLKVPFRLRDGQRIDVTPVHEALREALANALSHADYWGSGGVVVLQEQDGFSFRNPGTLRLPLEQVLEGGHTDPRNNSLHRMFLMVGAGERAGSGMPRILGAWNEQHWRVPNLVEGVSPDTVTLKLTMQSLLPEPAVRALAERFGPEFDALTPDERLALVTVEVEGEVSNERLQGITTLHSADITRLLAHLSNRRLLHPEGQGRWMRYRLPEASVSGQPGLRASTVPEDQPLMPDDASVLPEDQPLVPGDASVLPDEGLPHPARLGKRAQTRAQMEAAILEACQGQFKTLMQLGQELHRSPETLSGHYIPRMLRAGVLELQFPLTPTRKGQAYRAAEHPRPQSQEPS